jgi:hypothetical protein
LDILPPVTSTDGCSLHGPIESNIVDINNMDPPMFHAQTSDPSWTRVGLARYFLEEAHINNGSFLFFISVVVGKLNLMHEAH